MNTETIVIGLQVKDDVFDLKIPVAVSIQRLKELLREALALIHVFLPADYHLLLKNKPLKLSDSALLSDYPVYNGDQLMVSVHTLND